MGAEPKYDSFTTALLAQSSAIPGLDESIIIPARRLHLTLGVMSLIRDEETEGTSEANANKTISSAIAFLQSLRPRIIDELGGAGLRIPLERIGIMKPERGNMERAHVMFAGPAVEDPMSEDVRRLKRVCGKCSTKLAIGVVLIMGRLD